MNDYFKLIEGSTNDCPISEIAKSMKDKSMDVNQLDKPIAYELTNSLKHESAEKDVSRGLTDAERSKIKNETGWSDEIVDNISSMKEYDIYRKADLHEADIDGRKCLEDHVDWDQTDENGLTNRERAERKLSPINKNGETVELHHIGQKDDSPLAELTEREHRSKETNSVLHDTTKKDSDIDKNNFNNNVRPQHWLASANNTQ